MADVERVVRPRGDREPRLERGVEHRRRDLADAAAEPRLQLAVDDHRRLAEAFLGRSLARRPVERELGAGRDQVPIDELGHEPHVVEPVGLPAVGRRVARDQLLDPHAPRLGRRALGARVLRPSGARRGPWRWRAAARIAFARRHVELEAVALGGDRDVDPVRRDQEVRVPGGLVDRAPEGGEPAIAPWPRRSRARARLRRQVEQAGEPPARQAPARLVERERDRRRQRRPYLRARRASSAARRDRRPLDAGPGARPGRARSRRAPRRSWPPPPSRSSFAAGAARHDDATSSPRRRSAASRCCWSISRASLPDEEIERGLVDLGRRMDVGAEDAHADPAEAAQGAEAVALTPGRLDARAPVDLDAERARADLPCATGRPELDGDVTQAVGAPLEPHRGDVRVEPADGHAGDAGAGGQLGRRAGEGEAEERADGRPAASRPAATTARRDGSADYASATVANGGRGACSRARHCTHTGGGRRRAAAAATRAALGSLDGGDDACATEPRATADLLDDLGRGRLEEMEARLVVRQEGGADVADRHAFARTAPRLQLGRGLRWRPPRRPCDLGR